MAPDFRVVGVVGLKPTVAEATPRFVACEEGFEPPTLDFTVPVL